jgi:arginine/lysine/ornithine decarboxylase
MKKIDFKNTYEQEMPLVSMMNRDMYGVIKWCTPSIHPSVPKINGIYDSDISISYHSLGNPSINTGVFRKAHDLASVAYQSDHTLFCVNGSSGSNFIVLRALSHQLKIVNILAQRNVHKSISVASEDYHININYLQPHYDQDLQIFIPNTIEEFEEGIKKYPETNVVFISNPTYEGLSIDLSKFVIRLRRINPKLIIYVDEAWGSLFPFSDKMPTSAMQAGADICVQSTHKQSSGLQQTSMIHWKENKINEKFIMDSYKSLITTSPSFHLLASLDAARFLMQTQGKSIIDDLISIAERLSLELSKIKGVRVVNHNYIIKKYPQVKSIDKTKVLVNIKGTGIPGYEIAKNLEEKYKVVLEKYEAENIFFISILQNTENEAIETAKRLKECITKLSKKKKLVKMDFPKLPLMIKKSLPSYEIINKDIQEISLEKSIGLICAEDVVPYPPGIPLIAKGEIISKEHVNYIKAIKKLKGLISIVMNDDKIEKILTVK